MAWGNAGGYAGDPRGRERAIQDRQQGQADVQSQVDSFSDFGKSSRGYDRGPSQDRMRFRTYSAPLPTPKTPVQKAYNEIRTKTPDMTAKKSVALTPKSPSNVVNTGTRDVNTQVDTFTAFNPSGSGKVGDAFRNAVTGTTTVGWNLHKTYSQHIENDPTLTAAQKDQKKAENLMTMGGMNPLYAGLMAFPYQGFSEISSSVKKGWGKEGWGLLNPAKLAGVIGQGEWDAASAGWNNLLGIGRGVAKKAANKGPWEQYLTWLGG